MALTSYGDKTLFLNKTHKKTLEEECKGKIKAKSGRIFHCHPEQQRNSSHWTGKEGRRGKETKIIPRDVLCLKRNCPALPLATTKRVDHENRQQQKETRKTRAKTQWKRRSCFFSVFITKETQVSLT